MRAFPRWAWALLALLVIVALVSTLGPRLWAAISTPPPTAPPTNLPATIPSSTAQPTHLPPTASLPPTAPPTNLPTTNTWTRPADGMVMVYVPAGEFQMGSTEGASDEQPVHTVALDGFWIDQTEVTVAQFRAFAQATGYETTAEKEGWTYAWVDWAGYWQHVSGADWQHPRGPGSSAQDDHPVVQVSWEDAVAYCEWAGGRLPTEAEWEYAARGPQGYIYPWGNDFEGTRLNYCDANCPFPWLDEAVDDGYADTAPVGSYPAGASWVGALDMAGNVWEWVADWYGDYPSGRQENPAGPAWGQYRVVRGGSWDNGPNYVRAADRLRYGPGYRYGILGFRCARSS